MPQSSSSTIGFIGGTGPEGRGLAVRFAAAGHDVLIGSRDATRATEAADEVKNILAEVSDAADVRGALNADAAAASDIVFIAVPYAGMMASLEQLSSALSGKICVNVIAPGSTMSENVLARSNWKGGNADATVQTRAIKRHEEPQDLVGACIFLASGESDFVTGQTMVVDGGSAMW